MKYFVKSSPLIFILAFLAMLGALVGLQALFGTVRWYNESEERYERLHKNHVYSAADTIRVTIGSPLPTPSIQDTSPAFFLPPIGEESTFMSPVQTSVVPEGSQFPFGYKATLDVILGGTYFRDTLWEFPLRVDIDRASPRGQMANGSVMISGKIKTLSEMSKVLVHELGHMIDIYFLKKKGLQADPSTQFYKISWSEPTIIKRGISAASFVSGYAMTNQYEDFSESFTFYIFHNKEFLARAEKNTLLKQKYDFFKNTLFGEAFLGTEYEKDVIPASIWDTTKIALVSQSLPELFSLFSRFLKYS